MSDDHTMLDNFQYKGYWWLPDDADNPAPGILSYDDDATTLDLFGAFKPRSFMDLGTVRQADQMPIILGTLENGQPCTLYKNIVTGTKMQLTGATSSKYTLRHLFIGKHFPTAADIRFSALRMSFTDLEAWMADSPFRPPDYKREGSEFVSVETGYDYPKAFSFTLPTLDAELKSLFGNSIRWGGFESFSHEHVAFLKITPSGFQDFEWFTSVEQTCRSLLTLFIGQPVYPKRLVGYGEKKQLSNGQSYTEDSRMYAQYPGGRHLKPKDPTDMLAPLPVIRDRVSEFVTNWFARTDVLRDAFNLFLGTYYNSSMYLESTFLVLTQALESYSRSVRPGKYVPEVDYEPIRDALVNAIPADVVGDFRQSLETRIRFGNDHSLRKRIGALLASLDPEIVKMFCPNPKAFRNRIVDTRNYLTHYSEELKPRAILGTDLYYANERLRLLLTVLLLKEVGLAELTIRQRVSQNPYWKQMSELYLSREI